MSQELLYTSAPHGLKPGSRGFCTVLSTQGMAAPLASALEGLSGYRPVFPPTDEQHSLNPISWSHVTLTVAGRTWHILSRVAEYGLDYSQRTNKLAHHVVLDSGEQITAGPAALLASHGFMRDEWNEEPHLAPTKPVPKIPPRPRGVCQAWKDLTGDAGWAGVIAESFLRDPERPIILLYAPGQDMLPLINEALSLIPANRRWEVTFTTYFTGLPQTVNCNWRCMLADSPEAHQSLRFVRALRFDLTNPESLGIASGNELVAEARGVPRLKSAAQGSLPPLPITDDTYDSDDQTPSNGDGVPLADDVPPLPGNNTHQVRQNKIVPALRQSKRRPSADAAHADFERKRKIAALVGVASLVMLLVIGLTIGITRKARVRQEVAPVEELRTQIQPRDATTTEIESDTRSTEKPESAAVSQSPPIDKTVNKTSASDLKPTLSEPEKQSDPKPTIIAQNPIKSESSTAPDELAPSLIRAPLTANRKQLQELLSLHTRENPFLSITLFSPESSPLSGLSKPSPSKLLLEVQPKGSLSDKTFATVSSIKSTSPHVTNRSKYTLTLDVTGNDQSNLHKLGWCELVVLNRSSQPQNTRITLHPFPLKDTVLGATFHGSPEGLRAAWNLEIPTDKVIPSLKIAQLSVTLGAIEYNFVPDPRAGKLSDNVIGKLHCPELNSAVIKVLEDVDDAKIASAFTITVKTSSTSKSPETHEVVLELGGKSKLGSAFSITTSRKNGAKSIAKSSVDDVIRSLKSINRNTDVRNLLADFNNEKVPSKLAVAVEKLITPLSQESNALSLLPAENDKIKQLALDTARAAVTKALGSLNELKTKCEGIVRLERDLEQIEIKSTDLHYVVIAGPKDRHNVFIFNTTGK